MFALQKGVQTANVLGFVCHSFFVCTQTDKLKTNEFRINEIQSTDEYKNTHISSICVALLIKKAST